MIGSIGGGVGEVGDVYYYINKRAQIGEDLWIDNAVDGLPVGDFFINISRGGLGEFTFAAGSFFLVGKFRMKFEPLAAGVFFGILEPFGDAVKCFDVIVRVFERIPACLIFAFLVAVGVALIPRVDDKIRNADIFSGGNDGEPVGVGKVGGVNVVEHPLSAEQIIIGAEFSNNIVESGLLSFGRKLILFLNLVEEGLENLVGGVAVGDGRIGVAVENFTGKEAVTSFGFIEEFDFCAVAQIEDAIFAVGDGREFTWREFQNNVDAVP